MLKVYLGENTKNIYGANAEKYIWGEKGLPIVYSPEKSHLLCAINSKLIIKTMGK